METSNLLDVEEHETEQKKASFFSATLNFYKGCTGSGVLAIPYAFYKGGWIQGLIVFSLLPLMVIFTTNLLIRISSAHLKKEGLQFADVAWEILGGTASLLIKIFLIILQMGCCASYILFFMQMCQNAIYHDSDLTAAHMAIFFGIQLIFILPLILINDVAIFSNFSAISNMMTQLVLWCLFGLSIYNLNSSESNYQQNKTVYFDPKWFFFQAGIAIYAFEGIGLVFIIKASMREQHRMTSVVKIVGGVMITQNDSLSLLASMTYMSNTANQIILLCLPSSALTYTMQIIYSFALVITFPLQLFPVFQILEEIKSIHFFIGGNALKRTLFRFTVVVMITLMAVAIPDFATLVSFIGGLAGSVLQFWLPMGVYIKCQMTNDDMITQIGTLGICIAGIIFGLGATIQSLIMIF